MHNCYPALISATRFTEKQNVGSITLDFYMVITGLFLAGDVVAVAL